MRQLVIRRQSEFTDAMDALRRVGIDCPSITSRDLFDEGSIHVVAYADKDPVGMVRVTPAYRSVLNSWASEGWELPTGPDVVELTRGVVADEWREHGIYRLLMLEVLAGLKPVETRIATAAIEPDFVGRRFLENLGFRPQGAAQPFHDEPRNATLAVPIMTAIDAEHQDRWLTMLMTTERHLATIGIAVRGGGPDAAANSAHLVSRELTAPHNEVR